MSRFGPVARWLVPVLLVLSGCGCAQRTPSVVAAPVAAIPAFASAQDPVPAPAAELPAVDAFLAPEPAMRDWVHENIPRASDPRARLRQLTRRLLDPADRGVVYDPALTRTAAELFHQRTGNCLSFAGLFVVLAREAGLDAGFQDVPVLPNWRLDGDAFVVERHVNVIVRSGGEEYVVDFRPPAALANTRARRISDANATAQYFGNLGVERFRQGDLAGAYALFRRGLEADAGAAPLWVNLGVVLGRNGQFDDAVAAYEQALRLEPLNLSALSNLAGAESVRGNAARAAELQRRVASYREQNPYYQYWVGEKLLQEGNARGALDAWRAAVRLMPEEADFHFALARAWRALGRAQSAQLSLQDALARAPTDGARMRYRQRFAELPPPAPESAAEQGDPR